MKIKLTFLLTCFLMFGWVNAQNWPCLGVPAFEADFSGGLPVGWTTLDIDSLTPNPQLGVQPGWFSDTDYVDSSNQAMFSASWYLPPGRSDDWLITSQIFVPQNGCFSFQTWSVDGFYPEALEVWISSTTPDTSGFFADSLLGTISAVSGNKFYFAANLAYWGGMQVYIGFRHISDDQYMIGLDNVRVTNVNVLDAAVVEVNPITIQALDSVRITGRLMNAGSDTLRSAEIRWTENGVNSSVLSLDSILLGPNQTLVFTHPQWFRPQTLGNYLICAYSQNPNHLQDPNIWNDSICQTDSIVEFVGRDSDIQELNVQAFPNPFENDIYVEFRGEEPLQFSLISVDGRVIGEWILEKSGKIEFPSLPSGVYILNARGPKGAGYLKLIRL